MSELNRIILLLAVFTCPIASSIAGEAPLAKEPLSFFWRTPAKPWDPALNPEHRGKAEDMTAGGMWAMPIGNGRLGGMIYGGIEREHILLNEDSLRSGGVYHGDPKEYGRTRDYVARDMARGCYQPFGDIYIELEGQAKDVGTYRRDMNLRTGVAGVSYKAGGVSYEREYFSNYPDQVLVSRLSCSKPGALNIDINLLCRQQDSAVTFDGKDMLMLKGVCDGIPPDNPPRGYGMDKDENWMDEYKGNKKKKYSVVKGVEFEGKIQLRVKGKDAKITAGKSSGWVSVKGADEVVLVFTGETAHSWKPPTTSFGRYTEALTSLSEWRRPVKQAA